MSHLDWLFEILNRDESDWKKICDNYRKERENKMTQATQVTSEVQKALDILKGDAKNEWISVGHFPAITSLVKDWEKRVEEDINLTRNYKMICDANKEQFAEIRGMRMRLNQMPTFSQEELGRANRRIHVLEDEVDDLHRRAKEDQARLNKQSNKMLDLNNTIDHIQEHFTDPGRKCRYEMQLEEAKKQVGDLEERMEFHKKQNAILQKRLDHGAVMLRNMVPTSYVVNVNEMKSVIEHLDPFNRAVSDEA